jgi:PAS domain S-box-containing protein
LAADPVVVICADEARRELFVAGLADEHLSAVGASQLAELAACAAAPSAIVLAPENRSELEAWIEAIRRDPRFAELPLLVLGAKSGTFDAADVLASGADDFAPSRATARELAARVRSRLHRRRGGANSEADRKLRTLQRYLDFFDSSADGILVLGLDGAVLFCNPAACAIVGRTAVELCSSRFDELLLLDGKRRFDDLRAGFSRGVFPSNVDLPMRTSYDERRVLNVSFNSVLRAEDGVIVSLRDVTADRATERELTKTKEFLQRVIDSSVDAVVSADMKGKVLLFNPAAERTYGYSLDEVVGKMNVAALYPDGTARQVMRCIRSQDYGGPGVLHGYETELRGKDGQAIPVMLSAALIVLRGRPIGSVGVFRDLRASRQLEAHLAVAHERLAAQEKRALIAELAGATAHELNQPLTAVMGYASLIMRHSHDDERLLRASQRIVSETERMAEIVRKIGKLTKYETKAYVGDTKIIDIDRSVDSEPPNSGY